MHGKTQKQTDNDDAYECGNVEHSHNEIERSQKYSVDTAK